MSINQSLSLSQHEYYQDLYDWVLRSFMIQEVEQAEEEEEHEMDEHDDYYAWGPSDIMEGNSPW